MSRKLSTAQRRTYAEGRAWRKYLRECQKAGIENIVTGPRWSGFAAGWDAGVKWGRNKAKAAARAVTTPPWVKGPNEQYMMAEAEE